MKKIINSKGIMVLFVFLLTIGFNFVKAQTSDQKSKTLIQALEKVNGGWDALAKLKDVEFTYTYFDKGKNGTDISIERYIFGDETSWASYQKHEVNVLPDENGQVKQLLIDGRANITLDGKHVTDQQALGGTTFLRKANYFWFTMMYKLDDPGTNHKYLGTETFNGIAYDKVSLTYNSEEVGKETNDEYILYFNPDTHLVDLFYFSLPAWGVQKPVLRMELEYEKIKGVYIATKRTGVFPNADGEYQVGGKYTSENIKFKNGFTKKQLGI